jgi:hypothetical protein
MGHFEVLQWAREQGCPWDAGHVYQWAAARGHQEIVEWVKEQLSLLMP